MMQMLAQFGDATYQLAGLPQGNVSTDQVAGWRSNLFGVICDERREMYRQIAEALKDVPGYIPIV
jgi:hypothetical protein